MPGPLASGAGGFSGTVEARCHPVVGNRLLGTVLIPEDRVLQALGASMRLQDPPDLRGDRLRSLTDRVPSTVVPTLRRVGSGPGGEAAALVLPEALPPKGVQGVSVAVGAHVADAPTWLPDEERLPLKPPVVERMCGGVIHEKSTNGPATHREMRVRRLAAAPSTGPLALLRKLGHPSHR